MQSRAARRMFKDKLDIDPFRYVTLASLCMAIFRGCFLPDKSIVANEQNKPVSKVCKEWLLHLQDEKLIPEVPILIDKSKLTYDKNDLHRDNWTKTKRNITKVIDICLLLMLFARKGN